MSRFTALIFACLAFTLSATAQPSSPRTVTALDTGWLFQRDDVKGAEAIAFDASRWQKVSLPHTYNAVDGELGETFYRGPAWYRRSFIFHQTGARTYIEFDGAALTAEVWLNGHAVGHHEGGFARFRFDLTPWLAPGKNVLAVRVDNTRNTDIAPLTGDFSIFGGIYRQVRLVTTGAVHFDMLDYGSPGIQLRTPEIDGTHAIVHANLRLTNDTTGPTDTTLAVTVYDAQHKPVAAKTVAVALAPHATTPASLDVEVPTPHLWNGVKDPYLYQAEFTLTGPGKKVIDRQTIPFGIRTIKITADQGLLLNGQPYSVHGVDVHQAMRPGHGPAVGEKAAAEDFAILREMGVTGLRFAHYQHPQAEYDLADRIGLLIWTEVPFVKDAGKTDAFRANLAQQMRELIRQNVNHPSIMVWGIGNEVNPLPEVFESLAVSQKTAKEEDTSRPTTYAASLGPADDRRTSFADLNSYNEYLGWYYGEIGDWDQWLDDFHRVSDAKPMAVSEYGAGASIFHEEDPVRRPVVKSYWHPEQWQARIHEVSWTAMAKRPWLWAKFVWVGFDFPSAGRDEGDHKSRNDKGLVTYDRQGRKDAFFWYQANWTDKPMVYITSRRDIRRTTADIEVKVYSNASEATLTVNGRDLGSRKVENHIAVWRVHLNEGENRVAASAGAARDAVAWTYAPVPGPAK